MPGLSDGYADHFRNQNTVMKDEDVRVPVDPDYPLVSLNYLYNGRLNTYRVWKPLALLRMAEQCIAGGK